MQLLGWIKWLGLALVAVVLTGGSAMADGAVLSGTVTYRERILLPDTAVVRVQLQDVSLADAPALVLGEAVATGASPPYRYSIAYDPDAVVPGHRYSVSARISDGDTLLFVSTTNNPVFWDGVDVTEIMVQRVSTPIASNARPEGTWLAEDIAGGGVIDNVQTVLEFHADGKVSGTGGCNRFGGSADVDGEAIMFGQIVSTEMACAPAVMDQEGKFLNALEQVVAYSVDDERGKLMLFDAAGAQILVMARHDG